jgi:hypothetical protein
MSSGNVHQVSETMAAYVDWRAACLRASESYRAWSTSSGFDATIAFARYAAALDREERAAEVYAGLVRGVGRPDKNHQSQAGRLRAPAWGARWR